MSVHVIEINFQRSLFLVLFLTFPPSTNTLEGWEENGSKIEVNPFQVFALGIVPELWSVICQLYICSTEVSMDFGIAGEGE